MYMRKNADTQKDYLLKTGTSAMNGREGQQNRSNRIMSEHGKTLQAVL